jgi:hypothetical protein
MRKQKGKGELSILPILMGIGGIAYWILLNVLFGRVV